VLSLPNTTPITKVTTTVAKVKIAIREAAASARTATRRRLNVTNAVGLGKVR
jgi:hypothetical protein